MNTPTLNAGSKVRYVAAPSKEGAKPTVKDAVVVEVRGDQVLLDYSTEKEGAGQHTAQAAYHAYDKDNLVENTFHLPSGAVVEQLSAPPTASANGAAK